MQNKYITYFTNFYMYFYLYSFLMLVRKYSQFYIKLVKRNILKKKKSTSSRLTNKS